VQVRQTPRNLAANPSVSQLNFWIKAKTSPRRNTGGLYEI
jgi:hypothetical protein